MILIGEKLNSSVKSAASAYADADSTALETIIKSQIDAGADYLDINTALCENESVSLGRVLGLIPDGVKVMIDSTDAEVLEKTARSLSGKDFFLNSVTTNDRLSAVPAAAETGAKLVALPVGKNDKTADGRAETAFRLCERLISEGVLRENIFVDILAVSVAVGDCNAKTALETLCLLKKEGIKTICGLSNISYGLPERKNLNCAFLAMCISHGLDAAILDVTSPSVRSALAASRALMGEDEFCMDYITTMREKRQ